MTALNETPETILVVDDNEAGLRFVVRILRNAKFLVLSADSGPAAIELAEQTDEPIHLLLSDVDMPEMSGPDLGETLKKARPEMHVMLMSGQHDGNLLVLNYGWAFIRKPFIATKLVEMVTDVLHSPNRSQEGGEGFDTRKTLRKTRRRNRRNATIKQTSTRGTRRSTEDIQTNDRSAE